MIQLSPNFKGIFMDSSEKQYNTFKYFISNKKQIIAKLNLKLVELKGRKFICSDKELPIVEQEIINTQKAIRFNKRL